MNEMLWILFGAMCVALIGWMLYMATYRTDDWLRLVKDEEERKAKRYARMEQSAKAGFWLIRWIMKK